jgi:predicted GIY-YIG superfamily endonuclease
VPEIAALCNGVVDDFGFYVYYLCDDQEILYVGQSTRLMSRMNHHIHGRNKKYFRYLLYRQCESQDQMLQLEAHEIERLKPRLNKNIPNPPRTEEQRAEARRRISEHLNILVAPHLEAVPPVGR